MNIREEREVLEEKTLSDYAVLSSKTKGRIEYEEKCRIRTEFQRDRDRIIHSKAFRRLKHKTQVFIAPEGDHFRTRLTHTLEVSQIARTIGRALRLNEDLIESIALGHDLGHTPFGHTGERILKELNKEGFSHNKQSLRVVDILEFRDQKQGLNLCREVREGIYNHSGREKPKTLEAMVVRYADRIAYINHDIDDALRADIISRADIPADCLAYLGETSSKRINKMIMDIIENSMDKDHIKMGEETEFYSKRLREFMFKRVYLDSQAKSQEKKAQYIISEIYRYYKENDLDEEQKLIYRGYSSTKDDMICDYIAGMTDRYALNKFKKLFIPESWDRY